MPNTLTALQPILFSAAQQVSAEPFGVVNAIAANFDNQGVAKGDVVKVPVAPSRAVVDFDPSNVSSTGADATAADVAVEITASKKVSWHLTGEQQRSLDNGAASSEWIRQLLAQGMRSLRNSAEADCAEAIKSGASYAVGTAGSAPFGSNLNSMVDVRKVLQDNGAPMADLQMCFDTSTGAALRKLGIVQEADKAGTADERRSGVLQRQFGFELRESAGVKLHTKGDGTSFVADGVQAVGATNLVVKTGTGDIDPGDIVTFAADSVTKYVVNQGRENAGAFRIGRPGLKVQIADNNAMTIGNNYTPILAFERSAVVGIMRPPLMPANPTMQQMLISDQFGMTYLMLDIAQYGQRTWELHLAWGFKAVQNEHIAILLS